MSGKVDLLLCLRAMQGLFMLVTLGLTAYVVHWYNVGYWRSMAPAELNFLLFSSVWTTFAIAFLVVAPMKFPRLAHKYVLFGAEVATMAFWYAGFVALAAFLTNRECFGRVCYCARAAAATGAFEWLLFAASTVYRAVVIYKGRKAPITKEAKLEEPV